MGKISGMEVKEIKKRILTVSLLLVLVTQVFAGIRATEWGMSKGDVRQIEGKPEGEEKNRLIYEDLISELETEVIYLFNHRNELYSIEYHFRMERPFLMRALEQFEKISEILHQNYGPPLGGDLYTDREKRIGILLLEKPIVEEWKKDDVTYVRHIVEEEDGYKHTLIYGHRALTDEFETFSKRKQMEKL
jgi:hypothetical protein